MQPENKPTGEVIAMPQPKKGCPFHRTGCEVSILRESKLMQGNIFQVVADCGAAGPQCMNRALAIAAWDVKRI